MFLLKHCVYFVTNFYYSCKTCLVIPLQVSRAQHHSENELAQYKRKYRFTLFQGVSVVVFIYFLKKMSRDFCEPLSGYVPLAGRLKRSVVRHHRPLSDGDIWVAFLPLDPTSPCRNITDHSCLKVYHKDPAQAFNHGPRPANGDARVSTTQTQESKS